MSKEELVGKLEMDLKKLKTDLQQSRNKENDLRDQIISYMSSKTTFLIGKLVVYLTCRNDESLCRRASSQV